MCQKVLFFLMVSLAGFIQCQDNGALVVYSHRMLRPDTPYEVTAKSFHASEAVKVTAEIYGCGHPLQRGVGCGTWTTEKIHTEGEKPNCRVYMGKGSKFTKLVNLICSWETTANNVRMPPTGNCLLLVRATYLGKSGKEDMKSHEVKCVPHDNIILIQLSKPLYKADEIVSYRILILNEDLLLASDIKTVDIYLKEPEGYIVEEHPLKNWWNHSHPGFIEDSFGAFPFNPIYGDWTIEVVAGRKNVTKTFKLDDYDLPRFAVYIDGPEHILRGESNIKFKVALRDQTGKPVSGSVNVTISSPGSRNVTSSLKALGGIARIDNYQIDHSAMQAQFCGPQRDVKGNVTIHVDAEERVTNKRARANKTIPYHCDPFRVRFSMPSRAFIPGEETLVNVQVLDPNGRPITDANQLDKDWLFLEQYVNEAWKHLTHKTIKFDRGTASLLCQPEQSARKMKVTARLRNFDHTAQFQARYGGNVVITLFDGRERTWKIGELVKFALHCSQQCHFTKRSFVHKVGYRESKHPELSIPVTADMAPAARIVAYYSHDHTIVSASAEFFVEQESMIQNVTLTVKPEDPAFAYVVPGRKKKAKVELTAPKGSIVGLLAVDKNLLQLATGHDITPTEVKAKFLGLMDQYQISRRKAACKPGGKVKQNSETDCEPESTASFTDSNLRVSIFHNQYLSSSEGNQKTHEEDKEDEVTEKNPLRKDFRDSFMWITKVVDGSGQVSFSEPVPDSITTWAVTAFSASAHTPLALTKSPSELKVYQDFYIHMDLPNTIIEGETVKVNISVYNFLAVPSGVLKVGFKMRGDKPTENSTDLLSAPEATCVTFTYPLGPFVTGMLIANASLSYDGKLIDRVQKSLSVIKAGISKIETGETYELKGAVADGEKNSLNIPVKRAAPTAGSRLVNGSTSVRLIYSGHALAPAMTQLTLPKMSRDFDGLIRLPTGCGEQNMAVLMPNVFLAIFLTRIGWNPSNGDDRMKRLISNIEEGFQRQTKYRHRDGSYSAWGGYDTSGSTWLTAYVVRGMRLAKTVVPKMDDSQIQSSLDFLASKMIQTGPGSGSFREDGKIIHRDYQGVSAYKDGLTAFVLLAFLDAGHTASACELSKPKQYLEKAFVTNQEPYTVGLICYVLSRMASSQTRDCIKRLLSLSTEQPNGLRYWRDGTSTTVFTALDVEATAYAVLALNNASNVYNATTPISQAVKWLLSQRNGVGGFYSTHDTSVALNALSDISEKHSRNPEPLQLEIYDTKRVKRATITPDSFKKHTEWIPVSAKEITVTASGKGSAQLRLEYKWNEKPQNLPKRVFTRAENKTFELQSRHVFEPRVSLNTDNQHKTLQMEICPEYNGVVASGMVILEVFALTGYRFDEEGVKNNQEQAHLGIRNAQCLDDCTSVLFYISQLTTDKTACINIEQQQHFDSDGDKLEPRPIKIYRYYAPEVRREVEYSLDIVIER